MLKDFGFANSTTIDSGGSEIVGSGGTDRAATVNSSGKLTVLSGGTAIDTTIASGSTATVMAGGILAADAGGTAVVSGTVVNSGKLLASAAGGLIDIVGVVSGGVTVIGNGKVEIAGASSENVSFLNGFGGLKLDGLGNTYTGKITGFGGVAHANHVQFIDFAGVSVFGTVISFTSAASHTSGTLTVTDGAHSASVTLVGKYVTSNFARSMTAADTSKSSIRRPSSPGRSSFRADRRLLPRTATSAPAPPRRSATQRTAAAPAAPSRSATARAPQPSRCSATT